MTVTLDLPPHVEKAYLAEARAKGVPLDDLMRAVLIAGQPALPVTETVFEQGLGLFGSPEDAALLDEAVAIAYQERRRPANLSIVLSSMAKLPLDTDILSEYLKGHDQTVANRAALYARQHGMFTFTSVTVYEIVYGLELKAAASQLKKALAWLNQNEQITPLNADYLAAATIKATARKQGSILETSGLPYWRDRRSASDAACNRRHRGLPGYSKDGDRTDQSRIGEK